MSDSQHQGSSIQDCPSERGQLGSLKADIARGLADMEAGRMQPLDAQRIVGRGRKLLDGSREFRPSEQPE